MVKPSPNGWRRTPIIVATSVVPLALVVSGCGSSRGISSDAKSPPMRRVSAPGPDERLDAPKPEQSDVLPASGEETSGNEVRLPSARARRFAKQRHREAQALFHAGRYRAANAKLEEAIANDPMDAEAYLLRGKIYLMQGSALQDVELLKDALITFKLAYSIDPSLMEAGELHELLLNDRLLQEETQ